MMSTTIINPEYVAAMVEIAKNESLYSEEKNLPKILQDFIAIANDKGLILKVTYGIHKNYVGFRLEINGKAQFVEDYIVEDESKYDDGVKWFKKSLKHTFGV